MNADILKFYTSKGWEIFPCKPKDKTPLVRWADEATTEWNKVTGWMDHFDDMNIGIATGKRSGIFVVDIDKGHRGFESLTDLESKYGKLPNTPVVLTGGGGKHYFFKHPNTEIRNVQNSGKLGEGIDVRGDGGYVIAAPSIHPNGNEYRWDKEHAPSNTPLAEAPAWMVALLTSPDVAPQPVVSDENAAINSGGRNNTLVSLAGVMRRRGMSEAAILNALLVENKTKCIPPLEESEVRKIAQSISTYQPTVEFEQRDRIKAEWAFIKSLYEYPTNVPDFLHVQADAFGTQSLKTWWTGILQGEDMANLTINCGILADLENFKDYDPFRVDAYAAAVIRYGYLSKVERYADILKNASRTGNDPQIDKVINEINKNVSTTTRSIEALGEIAEQVEEEIKLRASNPTDVWGIPYAWSHISKLTGGKQKGELILCSAEPKIGKSWWWLQDAMVTAVNNDTPVFYWCGEMRKPQLMKRFYQLLGVNGRSMKTGRMTDDDWDNLNDAKALILNSPLYIDDRPLALHELRPLLARQKQEHGICQFIIDYASKIIAPGRDEIEQSQNISKEVKNICLDLDMAGVLITSVNKMGMDGKGESVTKGNVRGSGQQIHDADIIYIMTKFKESYGVEYGLMPESYEKTVMLHIAAGRELDHQIEGGFIPYTRAGLTPKFVELEKRDRR